MSPTIKPNVNIYRAMRSAEPVENIAEDHRIIDAKFENGKMTYTVAPKGLWGHLLWIFKRNDASIIKAHQDALAHEYQEIYDFSFPENEPTKSSFFSASPIKAIHPQRKGDLIVKETLDFQNRIKEQQFEKEYDTLFKKASSFNKDQEAISPGQLYEAAPASNELLKFVRSAEKIFPKNPVWSARKRDAIEKTEEIQKEEEGTSPFLRTLTAQGKPLGEDDLFKENDTFFRTQKGNRVGNAPLTQKMSRALSALTSAVPASTSKGKVKTAEEEYENGYQAILKQAREANPNTTIDEVISKWKEVEKFATYAKSQLDNKYLWKGRAEEAEKELRILSKFDNAILETRPRSPLLSRHKSSSSVTTSEITSESSGRRSKTNSLSSQSSQENSDFLDLTTEEGRRAAFGEPSK